MTRWEWGWLFHVEAGGYWPARPSQVRTHRPEQMSLFE